MPLLGYKVFHLKAPPSSVDTDDAVFVISHTNELFQSKDEYQKRVALYKSPVWTCQCTGQLNLTHEEAWISEKNARESLKEGFPAHYEVPTLEKVHHSTDKLDQIVDKCWQLFHETFVINEPITLKVKANGRQFAGRVVRIDKGSSVPNGDCSSPSSDKENKSSGNSETESPRKWKPKLLPYAYSMKLSTEEKIVNGIPAADIERGTRPPSKELLRLFIRTHAVRYGSLVSSPWVVEDKLVRKYSLKDKCPDLSVHKDRQQEAIERAVEEILRKRKADGKDQKSPPAKKQKLSDKSDKSKKSSEKKKSKKDERKSPHKQSMLNFSAAKSPKKDVNKCDTTKSPRKTPKSPRVVEVSDSSDDENLSLKRTKLLNGECDLSARERTMSSSSDDDVTLADIARQSPAKTPDSKRGRKLTLKTKANVLLNRKGEEVKPKNKKKTKKGEADGKKTKQLTLFGAGGVKKDGTPKSTPRNSPMKQGTPKSPARTPRICTKILKAMNADDKGLVKKLTLQAARELSSKQVKNMPEGDLKSSIEAKVNFIQERQRFKNMTPEQRLAHKKKKIAEMKAKARLQNKQAKMRFEDQDIDGSPLPKPKLVPTPEGLPNECFGDVAMVTEFLACYKDLLMPDVKQCPFSAEEMMQSLSTGKDGFHYLAKVLVVILQTLLQDQIAEDYRELHCPLSDIPVNNYTASEIVRLCLRRHDQDGRPRDADDDRDDEEDDDLPDELIEQLESSEFYELEAKQKLSVLSSLCSRVLGTYSVQDFMEERQKELAKVWKLRINCLKEKNDELKKKKEEKKSANQEPADESSKLNGSEEGTLLDFMKTKSPEKELDLATKVKRRRELAAKSAAEREEREKEQKRLRQLEIDEYKKQVKRQQMEQKFEEVSSRTKIVTRQCPIGTDRNHDRYWVFSNSLPGLFVEKGWVTENISYNVRKANADDDSDMDSEDSAGEEEGAKESEEKKEERKNHALEKSTPHSGQNLWFLYDTKEEIDQLLDRLHKQGVREQQLKTAIEKNMPQLMSALGLGKCLTPGCDSKGNTNGYSKTHLAISACPVANPPEKDDKEKDDEEKEEEEKENKDASEEKKEEKEMETKPSEEKEESSENEMLAGFKRELMDTEMRLRNGGLGGVPEFLLWETRLLSSQTFQTAAQCLLETQQGVQERFLDGIMQRKKVKAAPVSEDVKEEKMDTEEPEAEVPRGVQNWREALETATTWSRIHVLLGILDSCVKWEKSAEHAKCKICRKKKDDYEELILCDECNQPFHLYCLRPALFSVPKGDWFCPACIPTSQKRRSRVPMRYDEGGDDSATDIEGEEKEENCCMCGGDEGLITCSKCPSSYHLDCHDPPLRHEPRGRWECQPCKSGVSRRKRPRAVKQPPPKRRGVVDSESESSESTEEEDNNENAETDDELREAIDESMKSSRQRNRQSATQASTVRSSARPHRPSRRVVDSSTDEDDSPKRKSGRVRTSTGPKPVDPSIFAEITSRLYRHRSSWPFREPVDPEEVPDYYEIITTPITLLDVQERCAEEEYQVVDDYIRDITLLFNNAQEYNRSDSDVYQCMCLLEKYFKETTGKLIPHYTYEREFEVSATRRRSGTTR